MIYSASEAVQLLALTALFVLALVRALRSRNVAWLSVVCFFACMLLGNVYWYGYLAVFGDTPHYSYIADLSWVAGYVFLTLLLVECDQRRSVAAPVPAAWLVVALCAALCVFYIVVSGDPLLNIADNGLVAAIGFFAVRGIAARAGGASEDRPERRCFSGNKAFHWAALLFVVAEQALWLSSLVPDPSPGSAVYTVFNFALTASYASILACAWKSEDA